MQAIPSGEEAQFHMARFASSPPPGSHTWHFLITQLQAPPTVSSSLLPLLLPPPSHLHNSLHFHPPMLRRLSLSSSSSSSLRCFFSRHSHSLSSPSPSPHCLPSLSLSLPFLPVSRRRFHAFKVFAMAERKSEDASSQSHQHTNRLAKEHSPYLLQHAHNPAFGANRVYVSEENAKLLNDLILLVSRGETLSLLDTDGAYFDSSFSLKRLFGCVPKVDWYPWGEEAFAEARKRDVPIFLSSKFKFSTLLVDMLCAPLSDTAPAIGEFFIGKMCHVMEVESFEDEEVAKLLNYWFVSIKVRNVTICPGFVQQVDREERPDVDKVYMTYVQALYGGGGWPLSVFLSPDLKPLMGGTYFPPEDKYGRPGFKTILRKVKDAWDTKRDTLVKSGTFAIEQLAEALSASASSNKLPDGISQTALRLCAEQLSRSYDPKYGGFGSAPKFPRPVEIQLMLYWSKKLEETGKASEANKSLKMVFLSLQCMARGGIHDHIGGGFHRYSVDECWHVPHFEKMLYDQGQLANVYLDSFAITKDVYYSSIARDIFDYLRRDMIGPEGEIFSAEDADSAESEGDTRKKEGAFYIWTSKEIEDVLGEHATFFKEHYYIKPEGNCDLSSMSDPHKEFKGKNVLIERKSPSEMASKFGMRVEDYLDILGESRRKLFEVRSRRPRPHLDDKVIVSWNGLAISSFARASKILKGEAKGTKFHFPVVGCDIK
ncbi:hypothetical protein TIFTF001_007344 [Ficus carica]|uniref:Spermatogenesis-associated protein 20-like TRX domain-containing protein n=1 Tax=Ficus carica TaxID=3494 RepID=A0AA87ZQ78_FICCA|nr:hypothetical protein TIFTF001_007344 [Ficus carica]